AASSPNLSRGPHHEPPGAPETTHPSSHPPCKPSLRAKHRSEIAETHHSLTRTPHRSENGHFLPHVLGVLRMHSSLVKQTESDLSDTWAHKLKPRIRPCQKRLRGGADHVGMPPTLSNTSQRPKLHTRPSSIRRRRASVCAIISSRSLFHV